MENNKESELGNVSFSLINEEQLDTMVQITTRISKAVDINKTNSILDSRLGTYDSDRVCGTCCQTELTCPGHYGYIKLATPIIHPLMYDYLFKLLRSICHNCGQLIVDPKYLTGSSTLDRLDMAEKYGISTRECMNCGFFNNLVSKPQNYLSMPADAYKNIDLIEESLPTLKLTKHEPGVIMSMEKISLFLSTIKQEAKDALFIENTDLRAIIMTFLIVPPVIARPPVSVTGKIENSNLTAILDYLVKVNEDCLLDPNDKKKKNWLYRIIYRVLLKERPIIPFLKQYKNLEEQFGGKDGIIRRNGTGKRIDFSSRTVLSPASETSVGEMSYPKKATLEMTSPEVATIYNIDSLREKWYKGELFAITAKTDGHPLYNQVIKWTPSVAQTYAPYLKDVCHVYLRSGHMVLFNRQPTLDKYSLMGYFAKVVDRNTKVNGLNSCSTKPHNADFDGDEGNVYILQTQEAQLETMLVNNVRNNIVSNSHGRPIISIQYHGLLGLYLLTQDTTLLDEEDWQEGFDLFWDGKSAFFPGNIHGFTEDVQNRSSSNPTAGLSNPTAGLSNPTVGLNREIESSEKFKEKLASSGIHQRSGKALFSAILPDDLKYEKGGVEISLGILLKGVIDKDSVGSSSNNIIQIIKNLYGTESASDFLSSVQKMADWYMSKIGFTQSLYDVNPVNDKNQELELYYLSTNPKIKNSIGFVIENIHSIYRQIKENPNQELTGIPDIVTWTKNNMEELRNNEVKFGLNESYQPSIEHIVETSINEIDDKIRLLPNPDNMNFFEKTVRENQIISITELVNKNNRDAGISLLGGNSNPTVKMYKSGAKGSPGNTAQMSICIGQTMVYGSRALPVIAPTAKYPGGTRTMMFFEGLEDKNYNKDDVVSAGYINTSYVKGLDASQFIFMMGHERVGIITSRIAVPLAGALSRRMYRMYDDLLVGTLGDVVSAHNMFVNFGMVDGLDDSKAVVVKTSKFGTFFSPVDVQNVSNKLMSSYILNQ